ncbi:hypothetical protein ACJX0J_034671 [Zea mays]
MKWAEGWMKICQILAGENKSQEKRRFNSHISKCMCMKKWIWKFTGWKQQINNSDHFIFIGSIAVIHNFQQALTGRILSKNLKYYTDDYGSISIPRTCLHQTGDTH